MHKVLFIISSLFLLISCQPIMMKLYGVKDPDVENEKSIVKKALKFGLDTTNIVTVNSQDFPAALTQQGIPDGAIYDKDGNYIEYRQTDTSCYAGLFQFIPDLNLTNQYNKPASPNLSQQLAKFRDLKGNALKNVEPADFYLLIYWTVWTGKLNKDHVKIWEDLAKSNKNCKIKVIKVNLDIQEYWDAAEREKMVQMMNQKKK
jgi:hypothetical protein